MFVDDIMTADPVVCHTTDSCIEAARSLWDYDVGALPVVDDSGAIAGIITDRDICMATLAMATPLEALPVSRAMTTRVFTCQLGDSLEAVHEVLRESRVRRIPVVDANDIPIGIVSINDLIRRAASQSPSDSLIKTLAASCEPRRSSLRRTLRRP